MKLLAEVDAVRLVEALPGIGGWSVWITYASLLGERHEPLERQRGGVRWFSTLEAVARCIAAAGFSDFRVQVKPP